jgi:NitT/TauT family transport system substrate-binding protein
LFFFNDNQFDVKITSKTNGSFKLIASKDTNISSIEEIKGKTIGISTNTIIEYLTDRIMKNSNIDSDAPQKIAIPKIPTRLEMLQNGKLDAATLPEPLASVAIANGGKILSSSDQLGINPGVMIFTQTAIDAKPEEIKALYRAYNEAVIYLKEEKMENYIDVLIEEAGFPEVIKDTLTLPDYTKASMPSEKELEEVLAWLQSKELTSNTYSLKDLSNDTLIQ